MSGSPRNTGLPGLGSGGKCILVSMPTRSRSGPSRLPVAGLEMRRCCPNCRTRSPPTSPSAKSVPTEPMTRGAATPPSRRATPAPGLVSIHCRAQERAAMDGDHTRRTSPERNPSHHPPPWPHDLAALERLSPTKPGRDQDAMLQVARGASHGARLRQAGRRTTNPSGDPEPLHGPWNAANSASGMTPSNRRGNSASD